jgi:predicted SAM-dependent methyltransferase
MKRVLQRVWARRALQGQTRLHLGCGHNVLEGWANCDLSAAPGAIAMDLSQPLPVADDSIEQIYSEHFIEHLPRQTALRLLAECHRVLRLGGVLRLSTPDLRKLVEEYQAGRTTEWADVAWLPATPCALVNEGMRAWGHQYVYDWPELKDVLTRSGFGAVTRQRWRESRHADLNDLESRPDHGDLIVEAVK